ncbi:TonB-dependent siderophore receptor [Caenispirillum salinarum AK4]|uniref:TonB-dependent siderophore receptor n=1 Tax=Caenispirillum salinarum AK4 TaxID=1238182 RepID=K9HNG8_9PROT|nr:TonB-dependent siderophore receptor [Caenispirillum salinarum AK4]
MAAAAAGEAAGAAISGTGQVAQADDAVALDIPAGELNESLLALASATDLQIFYDASELEALRTQGVQGRLTPRQALDRLLAGSGLTYRFTGPDRVTLERPAAASQPATLAPITVSAARDGGALDTLSRNVTVITREQIETLRPTAENVADILSKTVPGLAPTSQTLTNFGQTLRGRNVLVMIDGVPMTTNRNISRDLFNITASNIESIEVVHGGSSVYGGEAAGGIIHINTLKGQDGQPVFETTVAGTSSLSTLDSESLGARLDQKVSGRTGGIDYVLSVSAEQTQGFFDAEGDRIPPEPSQGDLSDTGTLDVLGKLGYEFGDQRIQGTVSFMTAEQDTDYVSDPAVNAFPAGAVKARAIEGLQLDEQTATDNLVLNLEYSKADLFGSGIRAQTYYRDYNSRFFPFDGRPFGGWNAIAQTVLDSEVYGGRLTIDTPVEVAEGLDINLLWGADLNHETTEMPVNTFDGNAFDASGGTVFVNTGKRTFMPRTTTESRGVFGQFEFSPVDPLLLRAGVRHDWVDVSYPAFTTLGQGNRIAAGDLDYSETTYNVGAVLFPTDTIEVYGNYAQAFELPDIGLQLRQAPAGFGADNANLAPRITDSYEIGARGTFGDLSTSIAAFYSTSDLGRVTVQNFTFAQARTEERIYGVEAEADYRFSDRLGVGGTFTWLKGEQKAQNGDDYIALNSYRIPPIKLTGYVEYSPTDWWDLRLQALHSGHRDDAFDDGVGFGGRKVESYTVVDLYSAFDTGPGTLRVGVENLLNNQYHTVFGQLRRNNQNTSHLAARGATARASYSIEW